jgi:hypothetical protein
LSCRPALSVPEVSRRGKLVHRSRRGRLLTTMVRSEIRAWPADDGDYDISSMRPWSHASGCRAAKTPSHEALHRAGGWKRPKVRYRKKPIVPKHFLAEVLMPCVFPFLPPESVPSVTKYAVQVSYAVLLPSGSPRCTQRYAKFHVDLTRPDPLPAPMRVY